MCKMCFKAEQLGRESKHTQSICGHEYFPHDNLFLYHHGGKYNAVKEYCPEKQTHSAVILFTDKWCQSGWSPLEAVHALTDWHIKRGVTFFRRWFMTHRSERAIRTRKCVQSACICAQFSDTHWSLGQWIWRQQQQQLPPLQTHGTTQHNTPQQHRDLQSQVTMIPGKNHTSMGHLGDVQASSSTFSDFAVMGNHLAVSDFMISIYIGFLVWYSLTRDQ